MCHRCRCDSVNNEGRYAAATAMPRILYQVTPDSRHLFFGLGRKCNTRRISMAGMTHQQPLGQVSLVALFQGLDRLPPSRIRVLQPSFGPPKDSTRWWVTRGSTRKHTMLWSGVNRGNTCSSHDGMVQTKSNRQAHYPLQHKLSPTLSISGRPPHGRAVVVSR